METTPSQPVVARWRVWWRLARPFTLTASVVPVLVGTAVAIAARTFAAPDMFVAMLIASVLIQIATNMFNEYFDYKHGLDTPQTVGIAGAIVRGLVQPSTVFKGGTACYVAALLLGLFIVARAAYPLPPGEGGLARGGNSTRSRPRTEKSMSMSGIDTRSGLRKRSNSSP